MLSTANLLNTVTSVLYHIFIPPLHRRGVFCFTSVRPSEDIFLSNYWWQKSDVWSQASYRYAILWVAFLDPSDSYFLFADLVGFYTHWTLYAGYHKWALAHSSSCCVCPKLILIGFCHCFFSVRGGVLVYTHSW